MKKILFAMFMAAVLAFNAGCSRIETGEIGLRINASKQVEGTELQPGSWNQVLIGDVLTFPVRDIAINVENKQPLTADNSALGDLDFTVIYGINTSSVSDLWTTKSRSFNASTDKGDILLMYNYVTTVVNNAAYKAVRKYRALEVNDKRQAIEEDIKAIANEQLRADKLDTALSLNTVQVRKIDPAASIIESANAVVRAENELRAKEKEVAIAEAEARRMKALSENATSSIAMMDAQARLKVAEAVAAGKVSTIILPMDFKGMVQVK